jgi:hypothetical protein
MRGALIIAALAFASTVLANPSEELDKGRRSFQAKDWDSARKTIKDVLYPFVKVTRAEEEFEARALLGASLYELHDREGAVYEFKKALNIDFERSITTLSYSEGAVKLFDDTREQLRVEREQAAERKRLADEREAIERYKKSLVVYESHPYYVNFLPFGLGQLQNKQNLKAAALGIGQLTLFAASVGTYIYLAGTYGFNAKVPLEEGPRVLNIQRVEVASGIGFFALYAFSIYDALRNYHPNVRVKGDDSLLQQVDPAKPKPAPKKASFRDRLHIGPILTPSGVGLGVGWESD